MRADLADRGGIGDEGDEPDVAAAVRALEWNVLSDAGEEFGPCNSGGVVGPGLVVPCRLTPALGAIADEVLEALEVARDVAVGERDAHA
jgi:hypothetical protein